MLPLHQPAIIQLFRVTYPTYTYSPYFYGWLSPSLVTYLQGEVVTPNVDPMRIELTTVSLQGSPASLGTCEPINKNTKTTLVAAHTDYLLRTPTHFRWFYGRYCQRYSIYTEWIASKKVYTVPDYPLTASLCKESSFLSALRFVLLYCF